jgi:hypothetical protein
MEKNNEVRLKKIPLFIFLEALTDIYNRGVDYVDIIGVPGEEQDSIGISVKEEYFSNSEEEEEDEENVKPPKDFLSDEDLNQII